MKIVFTRFKEKPYFPVAFIKLVQEYTGLGLSRSKEIADKMVAHVLVSVEVPDEKANEFIEKAIKTGAMLEQSE